MSDIYNALISGGCGGTVAWIVANLQRRMTRREEDERRAFAALMEKRLSELEAASRRQGEMLAALNNLAASVQDLSNEIKRVLESDAAQSQAITNLTGYVANLREDLGELRREISLHIYQGRPSCANTRSAARS